MLVLGFLRKLVWRNENSKSVNELSRLANLTFISNILEMLCFSSFRDVHKWCHIFGYISFTKIGHHVIKVTIYIRTKSDRGSWITKKKTSSKIGCQLWMALHKLSLVFLQTVVDCNWHFLSMLYYSFKMNSPLSEPGIDIATYLRQPGN